MPNKKRAKQPILIYCEGLHDSTFIRHLHGIYCSNVHRNYFQIKTGMGGGPVSVVRKCKRVEGAFCLRIAKFDNDRGEQELQEAQKHAREGLKVTYSTPCIEATLLEILEPAKSYSNETTAKCKKIFHERYIHENNRVNRREYDVLFPRSVLEEARHRITDLDEIIRIFEDGDKWAS